MSLFSSQKKKAAKQTRKGKEEAAKRDTQKREHSLFAADVLLRPHITEKAAMGAERGMYTFEVRPQANKKQVAQAVRDMYNVDPVKVRTVSYAPQRFISRGRRGTRSGMKKAYVYLKEGEKIEFV